MYYFCSLYSSVLKVSVLSGFWDSTNPSQASEALKTVYRLYSVVSVLPVLITFVCNSLAVVTIDADTTRMIAVNFGAPLLLFDVINMLFKHDRMYSLVSGLDAVVKTLTEGELFKADDSGSDLFHRAAKVNSFFKYFLIPYLACPILTILYCWTCHFVFQTNDLIYEVPYDILSFPFSYELTLFVQNLSAMYASTKYIAGEGLYFCILFHLNLCLEQLKASSLFIFLRTGNIPIRENSVRNSLPYPEEMCVLESHLNTLRYKTWIKMHIEIIRLTHELNALYSVRLGLSLLAQFGVGLFMMYAAVMESAVLVESLTSFVCWVAILTVLLVPCNYGSNLTFQNSVLLEDVYDKVNGCGNVEIKMCTLITGEIVKKPLRISVVGCTFFDLSLDTFLWMLKTVGSFYVTLLQMKNVKMI